MFEETVVTVGFKPVLCDASDTGPDVFPPQQRLGALLPVRRLAEAELAARLQRVVAMEAELAAYKAELVLALADHRPDALDVPAGEAGAASEGWAAAQPPVIGGVSEFFCDELALILNVSRAEATKLTDIAAMLHHHVPATRAALADGVLDWPRARAIAAELRLAVEQTPPAVIAAVEAAVLPVAIDLSIRGLRAAVRRELLARDGLVAEARRRTAEKLADVTTRPTADGMAHLVAELPAPVAAALRETVDTYARLLKADGDPRPIGQLRALVLADLILRPWDTTRPPVTATIHLTAPVAVLEPIQIRTGEAAPVGEVDGTPITAGQVRELLEQLDALCPGGLHEPDGGTISIDFTDPDTGQLRATAELAELRRIAKAGLPGSPRLQLCRDRTTTTDRSICAHPGPTQIRPHPRPHLPHARLPQQGRPHRHRPHPSPRRRRRNRLREPLLPVPATPPAQDPHPGLGLRPRPRRHPARHHTHRRHPNHPTTRLAPAHPTTATTAGRRRSAALLSRAAVVTRPAWPGAEVVDPRQVLPDPGSQLS